MEASNQQGSDELAQLRAVADEAARRVAEAEARQAAAQPAAPAAPAAEAAQDDSAPQNDAVQVERERDRSR